MNDNTFWGIAIAIGGTLGMREVIALIASKFVRHKDEKKSDETDNILKEQAAFKEQIVFLKEQLSDAYDELDKVQDIINEKRQKITKLTNDLAILERKYNEVCLAKADVENNFIRYQKQIEERIESCECNSNCPIKECK